MRSHAAVFLFFALACTLCAVHAAPFVGSVGPGGPIGQPRPDNQRHGEITGGVQRTPGGTYVHGRANGDAWVSRDGNTRLNVGGHYGQMVNGPAKGARDYGVGANLEHRF